MTDDGSGDGRPGSDGGPSDDGRSDDGRSNDGRSNDARSDDARSAPAHDSDRAPASGDEPVVGRRRVLQLLAGGGALAATAGCRDLAGGALDDGSGLLGGDGSTGSTITPRSGGGVAGTAGGPAGGVADLEDVDGSDYSRVVDVAAAGAASDGSAAVNSVLERELADDTLLYFPPGRYRMDAPLELRSFANVGLAGQRASIVPADEPIGTLFVLGEPGNARDFRFDGLQFDFRGLDHVPRPCIVRVDDGLRVRDLSVLGPSRAVRFDVTAADGNGRVEGLDLRGSPADVFAVGCLVTDQTRGSLSFVDCHVSGFPNNGLYASPSRGPVEVRGGTFSDNGIANVRVGGDSVVRDVTVTCDTTDERFQNARGIWVRHGDDVLVENCEVRLTSVPSSDGAIPVGGSGTIRDTTIRVDADGIPAINVRKLTGSSSDGATPAGSGADSAPAGTAADPTPTPGEPTVTAPDGAVAVENVRVTGDAADGTAVTVTDRDDCVFSDLEIYQTGRDRDGLTAVRSRDLQISGADVRVTGNPIRLDGSTVETSNVEATVVASDASLPGGSVGAELDREDG